MNVLFLASRDSSHPQAGGGDLHVFEGGAKRLAERGHSVRYICSKGFAQPSQTTEGELQIERLGNLFTTAPKFTFQRWRDLRDWTDAIVEEVVGGLRIPYLSPLYADKPRVCFWFQRNDSIFKQQYGQGLGSVLSLLEWLVASLHHRSLFITPSHQSKRLLAELGIDPTRVYVAHPGLPSRLIELAGKIQVDKSPLIVALGKIRKYKCFHHAVLVLRDLSKLWGNEDARVVIAGRREDTQYESDLRNLAERLRLTNRVDFRLNLTEEEKSLLLARAKVLLIPSPREGFGIAALEANLFGTPVVATEGVPLEAVREGFNGFRVPFGDISAMAERTNKLLTDDEGTMRMRSNAIEFAHGFRWETTAEILEATLREAISRHSRR